MAQINGAYGRFEAGQEVNLPDDVAQAWVDHGVAVALEPRAAALAPTDSSAEESAETEPVLQVDPERTSRRRHPSAHPSAVQGPTWGDKR